MILYKGVNGLTKEEAVIIQKVKDEMEGGDAEYNWFEEKFGEQNIRWELNDQELIDEGDADSICEMQRINENYEELDDRLNVLLGNILVN